jgi:hypothetical protein
VGEGSEVLRIGTSDLRAPSVAQRGAAQHPVVVALVWSAAVLAVCVVVASVLLRTRTVD